MTPPFLIKILRAIMINQTKNNTFQSISNARHPHLKKTYCLPPFHLSKLTSAKSKTFDAKKYLSQIFITVWNFIKIYFFGVFYDTEKNPNEEHLNQTQKFNRLYFEAREQNLGSMNKAVVSEFEKLSKPVRKNIEKKIVSILREKLPKKTNAFYQEQLNQTLKKALQHHQKLGDDSIRVFANAVFEVEEDYLNAIGETPTLENLFRSFWSKIVKHT